MKFPVYTLAIDMHCVAVYLDNYSMTDCPQPISIQALRIHYLQLPKEKKLFKKKKPKIFRMHTHIRPVCSRHRMPVPLVCPDTM